MQPLLDLMGGVYGISGTNLKTEGNGRRADWISVFGPFPGGHLFFTGDCILSGPACKDPDKICLNAAGWIEYFKCAVFSVHQTEFLADGIDFCSSWRNHKHHASATQFLGYEISETGAYDPV